MCFLLAFLDAEAGLDPDMPLAWHHIKGYEGIYEVSYDGRVRSLDRMSSVNGHPRRVRGQILRQTPTGNGYMTVGLCRDGVVTTHYVHRLVAAAYLPKPADCEHVRHRSTDRTNNSAENLEWTNETVGPVPKLSLASKTKVVTRKAKRA